MKALSQSLLTLKDSSDERLRNIVQNLLKNFEYVWVIYGNAEEGYTDLVITLTRKEFLIDTNLTEKDLQ